MENKIDYEQLYYDQVYKNRKLKKENEILKDIINGLNVFEGEKNKKLSKYIIKEITRYQRKRR